MRSDEFCSCPNSFEKDCKIGYTCNAINGHCGCPLMHHVDQYRAQKDSKVRFTSSSPVQTGTENCKCEGNKREDCSEPFSCTSEGQCVCMLGVDRQVLSSKSC
eukprot:UN23008